MNRELAYVTSFFFFLQELARKLRPSTLRAKFGKTKVQNAVHCTDLPEDGLLEVILKYVLVRLSVNTTKIVFFNQYYSD
jgi:hypothetical protein